MNRLSLLACRPLIARVIGVCDSDARIISYLNEAQERLIPKGKWVGTLVRYRVCLNNSCITVPRQVETIEAWALCNFPGEIRNAFYEFVGNGPGLQTDKCGSPHQLIDRGTACVFNDMSGSNSFVNVQSSVAEAADARILIRGYDENAQWIRTQEPAASGTWIDGEYVAINTTGTRSVNKFSSVTETIKPVTKGPVRLYEWPQALGANYQQIAYYESDETIPIYRRYLIPNIANSGQCCGSTSDCEDKSVTLLVKLRHMPVTNDNDFLILGNLAALKLMVQSILKSERNLFAEAEAYEAKAVQLLQEELSSYMGDGEIPVIRFADSAIYGGGVENALGWSWGWGWGYYGR